MVINQSITKLLLIDGSEVLQKVFYDFLNTQENYHSIGLRDGNKLPTLLNKSRIDLIVLDIDLPTKNASYWLKWLQQYYSHIPIIIVSSSNDQYERLSWLECGVNDYVTKPFLCQELFIKINNILGKDLFRRTEKLVQIGTWILDAQRSIVKKGSKEIKLTLMENRILRLLYLNSDSPLTRDEIVAQVNGGICNQFARSVDTHISRLRKKIEDTPSSPLYIKTIRGRGYCLQVLNLETEITHSATPLIKPKTNVHVTKDKSFIIHNHLAFTSVLV